MTETDEENQHLLIDDKCEEGDEQEPASTRMRRKCISCIDVRMIPSKALFFLNDATQVLYLSYVIVFMTSIGLSIKEAGVIAGFSVITAVIAAPIWGAIADYTKSRRIVFVILVLGTCITMILIPWVAALCPKTNIKLKRFASRKFWTVLASQCVVVAFFNPLPGFTVSFVIEVVKNTPGAAYGNQTLFGGIGASICSVIASLLINIFHSDTLSHFSPAFWFIAFLSLFLIPTGLKTASQVKTPEKRGQNVKKYGSNRFGGVKLFISVANIPNCVFTMSVVISGICNNAISTYLYQLMIDQMGASNLQMGLARLCASVGEVCVFLSAEKIIPCFGGPINSIIVSLMSFSARFIILSYTTNGWWVLPTQLLHGLSFALFWVSVAEYTYTIAPDKIYTTVFSLVVSSYVNVGGVLGTIFSGIVYDDYSGGSLFFGIGCLSGSWCLFMFLLLQLYKLSSCRKVTVDRETMDDIAE